MSDIIIKHYFSVKNRVVTYYDNNLRNANLDAIEAEGGMGVETIKAKGKRISNDTYAYFFGGIVRTALQFERFGGWNEDDFRIWYENKFLSTRRALETYNDGGTIKQRVIITSKGDIRDLNQKQMNKFIEDVINDLALEGIIILTPEQYNLERYKTLREYARPTTE